MRHQHNLLTFTQSHLQSGLSQEQHVYDVLLAAKFLGPPLIWYHGISESLSRYLVIP